jgi:hypothetical protein
LTCILITIATPDSVPWTSAWPVCHVPAYNNTGVVQFSISTDGLVWTSSFDFTFHGYPVVTKVDPVASQLTGETPVVVAGDNIQWTQSIISIFSPFSLVFSSFQVVLLFFIIFFDCSYNCYWGLDSDADEGSYSVTLTSVRCPTPQSVTLSPPTVNLYVSIDNNPLEQIADFFYFGKFQVF